MLHDIGLKYVDAEIINSKIDLTADQWLKIEDHPRNGYQIALEWWGDEDIANWILHHHCVKGPRSRGYPTNDCNVLQIMPVGLQILICADRFDRGFTDTKKDAKAIASEIEHLAARRAIGLDVAHSFRRFIELGLHLAFYQDP
jgi:response regulator RpfG family c-di-GMP phosphodiesterase